jgi:hypothetical protein
MKSKNRCPWWAVRGDHLFAIDLGQPTFSKDIWIARQHLQLDGAPQRYYEVVCGNNVDLDETTRRVAGFGSSGTGKETG